MGSLYSVDGTTGNIITAGSIVATGSISSIGSDGIILQNQNFLEFDDTGSNSVSIASPIAISATYNLYWPTTQGIANSYLQNDGSGNLTFTNIMNFDSGNIISDGAGNITIGDDASIIFSSTPAQGGIVFSDDSTLGFDSASPPNISVATGNQANSILLEIFGLGNLAAGLAISPAAITFVSDIAASLNPPVYALSAVFEARSTTKGFLPPRLTTTQKLAISSPATGLIVYDITLNQLSYYNATTWINV